MLRILHALRSRLWSLEDRMTLRSQLAIATSVLCFIIVATLATGAALVGRYEAVKAATSNVNDIAASFTQSLDRGIANRLALVDHLAGLTPVAEMWQGPPMPLRHLLADSRSAIADAAWLGFATPDGVIKAAAGGAYEGQSVVHHAWFRQGLSRPVIVDSTADGARATNSAAFADTTIQRFIEIGVPVKDATGRTLGVLGLYVGGAWVDRLRASIIADADNSQAIRIALVHETGVVVAGNEASTPVLSATARNTVLAGARVLPPTEDIGNVLAGFAVSSGGAGSLVRPTWIVVAHQPTETAYLAADRVVWTVIALGLLVGIAGILGAGIIATRASRPFHELADKAALIGRDSFETLPRVRGSFEASRLSTVLRALVMRLGHAEQSTALAEDRAAQEARRLNRDIAALRDLVNVDTLTELLNRRAFMEFGRDALEQYRRYGRSFAVLMMDIDHFKRINDSLGHSAGDAVIRAVARTIAFTLRPSDKGARFGGEEFVALLREVSPEEALTIAERLRARIAALPTNVENQDLFVTISVGVSICSPADRDLQSMIERADVALYAAKESGRNRVVMAADHALDERRFA